MRQLGMFAKFPSPGLVKTRLATDIGERAAAEVYRACLETLLARFGHAGERRVLVFTPEDRGAEFALLAGKNWTAEPQSSGELGCRMKAYFRRAFAAGASHVILIGSDSPTLPAECIEQAFDLLATHAVVLGPSEDGGYYLVGAAGDVPPIFDGIQWSTATVWRETLEQLAAAGIDHAEMPVWYDIDTRDDLERLQRQLTEAVEPALLSLDERIASILAS